MNKLVESPEGRNLAEHKPIPFVKHCPPPCGNKKPCTKICRLCAEDAKLSWPNLAKDLRAHNTDCGKKLPASVNQTLFGVGKLHIRYHPTVDLRNRNFEEFF